MRFRALSSHPTGSHDFIPLGALFASVPHSLRDRNARGLELSLIVLTAGHVAGLVLWIQSAYAYYQGECSSEHESAAAGIAWAGAQTLLQILGMPAIVFACCWLLAAGRALSGIKISGLQLGSLTASLA